MRKEICKVCEKTFEVHNTRPPVTYCSLICKRSDYKSWHAVTLKKYIHPKKEKNVKPERFKWHKASYAEKLERLKANFEKIVIKSDGCWDSKLISHHSGYVDIQFGQKRIGLHRASWTIFNGNIPEDSFVLHKCDNKRCSNPDHLFLGTLKDNTQDKLTKGRANLPVGESHKNSKLTIEKVKKIKELLSLGVTMSRLEKDFNISNGALKAIKNGRTWKHVNLD